KKPMFQPTLSLAVFAWSITPVWAAARPPPSRSSVGTSTSDADRRMVLPSRRNGDRSGAASEPASVSFGDPSGSDSGLGEGSWADFLARPRATSRGAELTALTSPFGLRMILNVVPRDRPSRAFPRRTHVLRPRREPAARDPVPPRARRPRAARPPEAGRAARHPVDRHRSQPERRERRTPHRRELLRQRHERRLLERLR